MISVRQILKSLYDAVDGICGRTFLMERPRSVAESLNDYIVVKTVSSVINRELGEDGEYDYYETTAQIEVYVRDSISASNPNQVNINAVEEKVREVLSLFPIKDEYVHAMRPVVTLSISDGNGFHCTIIQAKLTTLI